MSTTKRLPVSDFFGNPELGSVVQLQIRLAELPRELECLRSVTPSTLVQAKKASGVVPTGYRVVTAERGDVASLVEELEAKGFVLVDGQRQLVWEEKSHKTHYDLRVVYSREVATVRLNAAKVRSALKTLLSSNLWKTAVYLNESVYKNKLTGKYHVLVNLSGKLEKSRKERVRVSGVQVGEPVPVVSDGVLHIVENSIELVTSA